MKFQITGLEIEVSPEEQKLLADTLLEMRAMDDAAIKERMGMFFPLIPLLVSVLNPTQLSQPFKPTDWAEYLKTPPAAEEPHTDEHCPAGVEGCNCNGTGHSDTEV